MRRIARTACLQLLTAPHSKHLTGAEATACITFVGNIRRALAAGATIDVRRTIRHITKCVRMRTRSCVAIGIKLSISGGAICR